MPDVADRPQIRHRDGELLRAGDLSDDLAREQELGQAHVTMTHRVWGAARGLGVAPSGSEVVIAPGVGFDARGRPLVVDRPIPVALPALAGSGSWWCDLLLFADDGLVGTGVGTGAGTEGGTAPRVRWSVAGVVTAGADLPLGPDVRPGLDIPLGRVAVAAGARPVPIGEVDLRTRQVAHGLVRPRVTSEELLAGTGSVSGKAGAWTIEVDTSAAGFSGVPYYVAALGADPLAAVAAGSPIDARIVGPYTAVTEAAAGSFRLLVWYGWPDTVPDRPTVLLVDLAALPVPLAWLGVQSLAVDPVAAPSAAASGDAR